MNKSELQKQLHEKHTVWLVYGAYVLLVAVIVGLLGIHIYNEHASHVVHYPQKWHAGVPAMIASTQNWISSSARHIPLSEINGQLQVYHSKHPIAYTYTTLSKHHGYNGRLVVYGLQHHLETVGSADSATGYEHPYYRKINHNSYEVISGNHTLTQDLYGGKAANIPNNCVIHLHKYHQISITMNHKTTWFHTTKHSVHYYHKTFNEEAYGSSSAPKNE